jgi:hypothetical protein
MSGFIYFEVGDIIEHRFPSDIINHYLVLDKLETNKQRYPFYSLLNLESGKYITRSVFVFTDPKMNKRVA